MNAPQQVKVWDPLVRIFHWALVLTFFTAYLIEDEWLTLHVWAGYTVLGLIVFRILLAFLVHTTLEWMDDKYQLLRQKLPSRKRLFNDIRTLTSYLCFASWEALMEFMLNSFKPALSQPKTG